MFIIIVYNFSFYLFDYLLNEQKPVGIQSNKNVIFKIRLKMINEIKIKNF